MANEFAVLCVSDAFEKIWPALAESVGAGLVERGWGEPWGAECPAGVLVGAGGAEEHARRRLLELELPDGVPVAVVGACTAHRTALELVRGGAHEYFALPGDLERLHAWMLECIDEERRAERVARLRSLNRLQFDFSAIVGDSPALRKALERAALVIPRGNATILITGETGTGKELLAQAIHHGGPRSGGPLVELNCSALPPTLLEAELFGYEAGAFTDAKHAKPGLLEAANGGSILLDEVGDLPLDLQAKVLRVLEEKRVRRIGSLKDAEVDVRIIAATHVNLEAEVERGRFRRDLYYRLRVIPIELPPLRDRGDDVIRLAEHFLARLAEEYELPTPPLSAEVRSALLRHPWRGNVRELKNAMERALVLGNGALSLDDLVSGETAPAEAAGTSLHLPFPSSMDDIERAAVELALERCDGNKSRAAQSLGISRKRLYNLLGEKVA